MDLAKNALLEGSVSWLSTVQQKVTPEKFQACMEILGRHVIASALAVAQDDNSLSNGVKALSHLSPY